MKNVFVSHVWDKENHYERLVDLLHNRDYFNFKNYSVSEEEPKNKWVEIENNIKWSSIVVFIATVSASNSYSIKKEIRLAKKHKKPTLAVLPHGAERTSTLRDECDREVAWNADSIVKAIRELT